MERSKGLGANRCAQWLTREVSRVVAVPDAAVETTRGTVRGGGGGGTCTGTLKLPLPGADWL